MEGREARGWAVLGAKYRSERKKLESKIKKGRFCSILTNTSNSDINAHIISIINKPGVQAKL